MPHGSYPAVRGRVADVGLAHAHFGLSDKLADAQALLADHGWEWPQLAVIGDDWPDLPVMQRVAFACAPANGHDQAKALAHHVTSERGGEGAARAFCDVLLVASGHYSRLLSQLNKPIDPAPPSPSGPSGPSA